MRDTYIYSLQNLDLSKNFFGSIIFRLQSAVRTFTPINNKLQLQNGQSVSYDFLVLATGIELRFDMVNNSSFVRFSKKLCTYT